MATKFIKTSSGFTLVAVLVMVVIMGIMTGIAGQSWRTFMAREREEELIFRGSQYRDAITRWHAPRTGQRAAPPLNDLKDLLLDPTTLTKTRYIRRLYKDPLTGEDLVPIKDPVRGIIGVASSSNDPPMKQANFPDGLEYLEGKKKYSEWQFTYQPASTTIQPNVTTR
ncbi:MAG: type II secretion system protein [Geobacteraceae bacterium]|nr:type II secretion system protein [Geobacteraceae bacterium]